MTSAILFPFGARLSTWLPACVFAALAIRRRDWRPVLACVAWMTGFEAAFQITSLIAYGAVGRELPVGPDGPIFYIVLAAVTVPWITKAGVRPYAPLLAAVACVWVVWIATGFHVNGHTMTGFSPEAEAINEAAKTLWALAYLIPLLSLERHLPGRPRPARSSVTA